MLVPLLLVLAVRVLFPVISSGEVKRQFLAANPQTTVRDVFVGEGWSDTAYFHIIHQDAAGLAREAIWCYTKKDGEWNVVHKEEGAAGSFDN